MTFNEANGRQLAAGHPRIRITKNLSSLATNAVFGSIQLRTVLFSLTLICPLH